jgi:hypothetical protein
VAFFDRDRWRVLSPILDRMLDLPEPARAAWLDELRAHSPELAAELTSLLASDAAANATEFLESPPDVRIDGPEPDA